VLAALTSFAAVCCSEQGSYKEMVTLVIMCDLTIGTQETYDIAVSFVAIELILHRCFHIFDLVWFDKQVWCLYVGVFNTCCEVPSVLEVSVHA
jgi:hypothetical protein